MATNRENEAHWFVMRDLRRSNAKVTAYQLLMQNGLEAFTPMTLVKDGKTGRKELVPIMQWLLFVHASKQEIDRFIEPGRPLIPHLQYIFERGKSSRYGGMTVSDRSMNYFRTALAKQEIPVVYRYTDITPDMRGRRVRVTRGDMIGYQGCLQKMTEGRGMRLFVELDGYCLAPIQVSPEDIAFIDDECSEMTQAEERVHYMRISRMVDVINYLRFSIPQDLGQLDDVQLAEVRKAYCMANGLFDEYHTREYLCVDEVCRRRLDDIERETMRRAKEGGVEKKTVFTDSLPWVESMERLCRLARTVDGHNI